MVFSTAPLFCTQRQERHFTSNLTENVSTWPLAWALMQQFIRTLPTKFYSLGITWSWIHTAVSPNQQRLRRNRASIEGGCPYQNWYSYLTAVHTEKKVFNVAQVVNCCWITPHISDFVLAGKNWPPSMKVKKLQKFGNKSGSMGCIWSSLNATGTGVPLSHLVLGLDDCPFPNIGPLG